MSNKPVTVSTPAETPSASRLCQELRTGSAIQRRAAADSLAEGRPFTAAVIKAFVQALADRDPAVASRAGDALRTLGPEAVRPLLDALKDPATDAAVLKAVARALVALAPGSPAYRHVRDLLCGDQTAQCDAAAALGGLGREASDVMPALAWSLRNGADVKVRDAAGLALVQLGAVLPGVVPTLARVLDGDTGTSGRHVGRSGDPKTHADILAQIGTPAAVAALVRVLRSHPNDAVRRSVAACLGAVEPPLPTAADALIEALSDGCPSVREAATQGLIATGEAASIGLTTALLGGVPEVRQRAANALGRMAPPSREVVEALARAMADDDVAVVLQAAVAILKIFTAHPSVRLASGPASAASGLAQRGKAEKGGRSSVRRGREDEQALTVLVGIVRRKAGGCRTRQEAAEALGRAGPAARPAIPTLTEILADGAEDRLVRQSVWWALQRIDPEEVAGLKSP